MEIQDITLRLERGLLKRINAPLRGVSSYIHSSIKVTLTDDWMHARPCAVFSDGIRPEIVTPTDSRGNTHRFAIPQRMLERGCFGFALISDHLHSTMPITITLGR